MIPYDFSKYARNQFKKLPKIEQKRIIKKLEFFLGTQNPLAFAKFIRREGGIPVYRFRIGNWRIIFDWEVKSIFVTEIRPRKFKRIYK